MEDARETMKRLYGDPIDVDKVWEDREAQYEADVSCPRLVEINQPSRLMYGPVDPTHFALKPEGDAEVRQTLDIKIVHHD